MVMHSGSGHGMMHEHPTIRKAMAEGNLVIVGEPSMGAAGAEKAMMASIIDAPTFVAMLRDTLRTRWKWKQGGLSSLKRALTTALLTRSGDELSRDDDFLGDMVVLLACRFALGEETALRDSGFRKIAFMVHPDEALPREQRGMLPLDVEVELFGSEQKPMDYKEIPGI